MPADDRSLSATRTAVPTSPPGGRPQAVSPVSLVTAAGWVGADLDPGATVPLLTGLTLNSRAVLPGDLYVAVPGARAHGADFAAAAVGAGAVAVLTDPEGASRLGPVPVPHCIVDDPRAVLGRLAAGMYGRPAEALTMLGITGTQGKTTTAYLVEAGLRGAGVVPGLVGTVGSRIGGAPVQTALTTPEAPELHALFALMRERGVDACAMEVSSHALVMGRVDGVRFDVAAFLNLGRDHLDFHRDAEDYFEAKATLFTPGRAARALVNLDDEHGRRLLARRSLPAETFSAVGADADWGCTDVRSHAGGTEFVLTAPDGGRHDASVRLPGAFNVANALAAIAICGCAGYDVGAVARGVARLDGVPGRMERIDAGQDFVTLLDYAHKPDAVSAVLTALRPVTPGRIVLVIGAGGDRDRGKRLLMGETAGRLADVVVVTDDNPRSEDPADIRAMLITGANEVPADERADVLEIGERGEAIREALGRATAGDCVVIAGKGHEQGQEIEDEVHPFDDRAVALEVLSRLGGTSCSR